MSAASVETIWHKITHVADISWHPLITQTDVPFGLTAKPGLIYQAIHRWIPWSFPIFVERVNPNRLISIRIVAFPGLEERVMYQIESDVRGTLISYSVMLRGWLAPFVWTFLESSAAKVAAQLAHAAETDGLLSAGNDWRSRRHDFGI